MVVQHDGKKTKTLIKKNMETDVKSVYSSIVHQTAVSMNVDF